MRNASGLLIMWLCALGASGYSQAPGAVPSTAPAAEEEALERPLDVLHNARLSGDWGGARKWLEDKGIEFGLSLTSVFQQNARGGLDTHDGHDITGSIDTELILDFEKMGLGTGGILYVLAESSWGRDIGIDKVGNLFGVNGDAYLGDYALQVSELSYQQTFLDGKVRAKVGKMDLMIDFDLNAYANDETTQFLNRVLVNMGNIPFPDYAQGLVAAIEPVDWMYVQGAVADAQAKGRQTGLDTFYHDECYTFSILELGLLPAWDTRLGKLPGGYRFMLWYDPRPKLDLQDVRHLSRSTDDTGFGFNMDQLLFQEKPDDEADAQGLGVFFRYGYAHDDVNAIEHFWSIGARYQGLLPTRDDDVLAFGFAQGIIGSPAHRVTRGDRESVCELYYNIALLPWLRITPDLQYVSQPGAKDASRDAFVLGVRLQMSF